MLFSGSPTMEQLMSVVGGFIALAIMLTIGTVIMGSVTLDCADISQANWSQQCTESRDQAIGGYGLLIITLIIIAAVAILAVVRML